ncbi:hypothetical protein E0Z10_g6065 [Xylaria hypoxylon]|uniref:Autophagy-related protein 6 n=1 Tax=Xylaria hypoxylon TaxID=37992 RepID=A0A4Z0YU99_9PEZI|nr:hypothetical protein E0Z10_g6065 [Xylaria hypoxylon]
MGWWDSLWASNASADDPLRKLDPKLRAFLEKESPVKYNSSNAPQTQASQKTADSTSPIPKAEAEGGSESGSESSSKPAVPRESQFQDGRYAHLWKSYKPLGEIEAETKSDHEKLMDVLEGYKERKAEIGRAALENCALEQVDWRICMSNPSWSERMTLCRDQVKKFEKCYMTQTRLLKALGYLSTIGQSPEIEEDIQMHADALYHRLLKQEIEIETAKKEGRTVPKFAPLVPKPMVNITAPEPELTPEQQETMKAKLEKVAEEDRMAEEEAIKGELRAKAEVLSKVQGLWKQQELERQIRKQKGEETMWDKVAGTFSNSNDQEKK